jgi:hypothetical protein
LDGEVAARLKAVHDAVGGDLDDRHDAQAALPKLREWMFLARLREQMEQRLEALEAEPGPSESTADSREPGEGPPVCRTVGR